MDFNLLNISLGKDYSLESLKKYIANEWSSSECPIMTNAIYETIRKHFKSLNLNQYNFEQNTQEIKKTLALIGNSMKYRVSANGLPNELTQQNGGLFSNHEWLYDLIWYREPQDSDIRGIKPCNPNRGYHLSSLDLAMECEWWGVRNEDENKDPYGEVKYDFQKIVIAYTKNRVMIFRTQNDELGSITSYFKRQILMLNAYRTSPILCIAYKNDMSDFVYKLF